MPTASETATASLVDETTDKDPGHTYHTKEPAIAHAAACNYSTPSQAGVSLMHGMSGGPIIEDGSEENMSVLEAISAQVEDALSTTLNPQTSRAIISTDEKVIQNTEHFPQYETLSTVGDQSTTGFGHDRFGLEHTFTADRYSIHSFSSSTRQKVGRTASITFLDQMVKAPSAHAVHDSQRYTETILIRYFREELAPWFDFCDPDRHFASVVPQLAREPGPLRSALLTISARSLSRNKTFRSDEGVVQWKSCLLPDLQEEFAMPFYNECIQDLLKVSLDSKRLHDETLLAAVSILRTDEELGLNVKNEEEDEQLVLRIASMFVDAQLPPYLALPHRSPRVFHPTPLEETSPPSSSLAESESGYTGLRQACFWTAFRQDLHAAFLKQQPVKFPLSRCEAFRQLSPASDAVWANRMVTFTADVLVFCYGADSVDAKVAPAYANQDRWYELRSHEAKLCALLPSTFEPTYCCEPNPAWGEIFPTLLYHETTHVSGATYIELARMLLEMFDPTRPKLGHRYLSATNAFVSSTKRRLFRLCGIALSNPHCPPSNINACLGIAMFGEYFEGPAEQMALLGVLSLMSNRYAYPTNQIANSLRRAWYSSEETSPPWFGVVDVD